MGGFNCLGCAGLSFFCFCDVPSWLEFDAESFSLLLVSNVLDFSSFSALPFYFLMVVLEYL